MAAEVFAARALILREPAKKLTCFLDIPWCKADLFYIQKLLFCIEAHGEVTWSDARLSFIEHPASSIETTFPR
jgi:hypothetical protein